MGGTSCERDVSLVSGACVASALTEAGYNTVTVDIGHDMGAVLAALEPRPDAIFNALHGRFGEDGCVQGLLELLHIPYTHSGVLASALAMDKPMAKRLFQTVGIPCADHVIAHRDDVLSGDVLPRPYVIKPLNEGSSVGVQIVLEETEPTILQSETWPFGDQVMVESYMVPAPVPPEIYQATLDHAVAAHEILGCRGVSRADLRYDDTTDDPGELYLLEINTQPGMTPLSLVPELADYAGISFAELVSWMVENAACDG
jgi:D-alanine-D-alanine ligase